MLDWNLTCNSFPVLTGFGYTLNVLKIAWTCSTDSVSSVKVPWLYSQDPKPKSAVKLFGSSNVFYTYLIQKKKKKLVFNYFEDI